MAPVRVARAFRLPIIAIMTALALSGCMHTTAPVAVAQPQGDLDSIAYGQSYAMAPAPTAVAYAAAPMPVAYDSAYRLDVGDKLRVVVYRHEGLTNTYAIDAGGAITMPLIGSVAARGRTPAGRSAEMFGKLRHRHIRQPS